MRLVTRSRQARLFERFTARRHRSRRARCEKSPTRGLRKRVDRSRLEDKASEMSDEQEQHTRRRRVFLAWAGRHVEALGVVIPLRQTRIDMEVRFGNLNPAYRFLFRLPAFAYLFPVQGGYRDVRAFDAEPVRVAGAHIDGSLLPEYVVVYSDPHALWMCEVFDRVRRWHADEFAQVAELALQRNAPAGDKSAALYPAKCVSLFTKSATPEI
jgi:hypothetical protein